MVYAVPFPRIYIHLRSIYDLCMWADCTWSDREAAKKLRAVVSAASSVPLYYVPSYLVRLRTYAHLRTTCR